MILRDDFLAQIADDDILADLNKNLFIINLYQQMTKFRFKLLWIDNFLTALMRLTPAKFKKRVDN